MKVVIIEDELLSAKRLKKLIQNTTPDIRVEGLLGSVHEALRWFEENEAPDLIFLDIQLSDGSGFEVISSLDDCPYIIFTTAYEQYALDAFKYNSIDYLLKPVDPQELKKALAKFERIQDTGDAQFQKKLQDLTSHFLPKFRQRFLVKVGLQYKSIDTSSVCYFYHEEGITYLRTHELDLPVDYTLDQLMGQLDPQTFFRINRKYLVAIKSVVEIHSYFNSRLLLTLDPSREEDVIVSRERVLNFKTWAGL